ncbi:MAG: phosphatidate cytidylyltransferase [Porticoccaceae bacterium]|nr:phosphatidate cytidylyltransferase [Porticoccaceae bacterium]
MLKQRFITAVILAVLFVSLLVVVSPAVFSSLIILVVVLAGWEWTSLANITSNSGRAGYLLVLFLLLAGASQILGVYGTFDQQLSYQISAAVVALWAVIFLWIQGYPSSSILWAPRPVLSILGLILLVATWIALVAIVRHESGRWLLLLALGIVVLADVGGYIAGNLFGRRKLAPTISPGKTWEGFLGALVLQLALIAMIKALLPTVDVVDLAILVFPVALCSVVGDLFESMLKRHRGLKDSSSLLPGHGGVLDRLDGIMAALPMFFVMLTQTNPF